MRGRSLKHVSETCGCRLRGWQIGQPCCGLDLLERRLVEPHATVVIPLDDRVLFVSSFNCAEFPIRFSEVTQTLDAISGNQFPAGERGLGERRLLRTV